MKIYDELVWRGLIKDVSSPDLEEKLNNGGMTFYIELIQQVIVYILVIFHLS